MEHHFSLYLVAFIDVLGQRHKLRELSLPQNNSEIERNKILEQLRNTAGKILRIRRDFDIAFSALSNPEPLVSNLPIEQKNELINIMKCDIKYHSFSDSIAINVPLTYQNEYYNGILGIYACFNALCLILTSSLIGDYPIRGGVEIGPCISMSETEVYGSALERAHYLESTVADYPRIVVGRELLDYIIAIEKVEIKSNFDKMAKHFAEQTRKLIMMDTDGRLFLDFLSDEVQTLASDVSIEEIYSKLEQFIYSSLKSFYGIDDKLYKRYVRLSNYVQIKKQMYLTRMNIKNSNIHQ